MTVVTPSSRPGNGLGGARKVMLLVHRYVGLVMAVFLFIAGLTGAFLVFYQELDRALNPVLMEVTPLSADTPLLDPFELTRRVQNQLPPGVQHQYVSFELKRDEAVGMWVELEHEEWREVFVDPYSGAVLGMRNWGDLSEGWSNLMPFLYRLHYALALDEVGTYLFGIVALLWTLDCFVGAYLTFPLRQRSGEGGAPKKPWLARWAPAWLLRTTKLFSLVFTWHRASGLWVWAMLLVFAWSAVGLNLYEVYHPVMKHTLGYEERTHDKLPELPPPYPVPQLTPRQAHEVGRRLMAVEAERRGFQVIRELHLDYHGHHGAYSYGVESTLDISEKYPDTEIYFDGQEGHLIGFDAPTGGNIGNTVTSWIFALHFGSVWGLWYRVFVSVMGIAVALLSITGVWIWFRKRNKRSLELDRLGELAS